MKHRTPESTFVPPERAFLFGVQIFGEETFLSGEDSLAELALLADTAGLEVAGTDYQKISSPNPSTLIGSGKVEELKLLTEDLQVDVLVFDHELSPRHQKELEEKLGDNIKILDRTALILDIFAQHASTKEGMLQVELAQLNYRLPRLTRAWTHLARQSGGAAGRTGSVGGVGLRGPGETQLEVDKREIRRKIAKLNDELDKVRKNRALYREQRKKSRIPIVALVGYTNAGKSTLLNALSNSAVYIADQLFATLDPTTRKIELPGGSHILLTDTVGFIQKLPTQLIAAFRATLEEVSEADLLLHVVDMTHPNALAQWKSVQQTLVEIEAESIPTVTILNKMDKINKGLDVLNQNFSIPAAIPISALQKQGLDNLLRIIEDKLCHDSNSIKVFLPYEKGSLLSLFHSVGRIVTRENLEDGIFLQGSLPKEYLIQFNPYVVKKYPPKKEGL